MNARDLGAVRGALSKFIVHNYKFEIRDNFQIYMLFGPIKYCLGLALTLSNAFAQSGGNTPLEPDNETINATQPTEISLPPVEVQSTKNPDWKRYRSMLLALDAFDKNHRLAPQTAARFILRPSNAGASMNGLTLRLVGKETSLPLALADDGSFTLPRDKQLQDEDAELTINRKREMFHWRPHIRSALSAPDQRRLGDLRLECEMLAAYGLDDWPYILRSAVQLVGGPCNSKKIGVSFPADYEDLKSAVLISDDKRIDLVIDKKASTFTVPLEDQALRNDAIVKLEYEKIGLARTNNLSPMFLLIKFF